MLPHTKAISKVFEQMFKGISMLVDKNQPHTKSTVFKLMFKGLVAIDCQTNECFKQLAIVDESDGIMAPAATPRRPQKCPSQCSKEGSQLLTKTSHCFKQLTIVDEMGGEIAVVARHKGDHKSFQTNVQRNYHNCSQKQILV